MTMDWFDVQRWGPLVAAVIAVVAALIVHRIGRTVLRRVVAFSPTLSAILRHVDRPARLLLPLIALQLVWQGVPGEPAWLPGVRHLTAVLIIGAFTWLLVAAVSGVAEAVLARYPLAVEDNLEARRIHTQTRVLSRIAMVVLLIAGVAFALMTFPGARQVGTSLLASAGIISLVAGIAAQSVFGNLIAGLQIALSQPIRIDDVLIVDGEWGRVEEITSTYVVLKIWDQRRLIIPLKRLIEQPFQNWTRSESEIIGTVFLWVDYTTPLEPLRQEAQRLCESSPDWDGRLCKLQVTDVSDRAIQVRVLATSANSGQNWDLRCYLREGLIDFLQREQARHLPRQRAQVEGTLAQAERAPAAANEPAPAPRPVRS